MPNYRQILIHESSPGSRSSDYLKKECQNYSCSQYFPDITPGEIHRGFRCENLENLTFSDGSFDLFITQDVFEHILHPDKAFKEIARVLKPGGMHIFTMSWYPELQHSRQRATIENGEIKYLEKAVYHGNPISDRGSLVTYDWGADFVDYVYKHSGMSTTIYLHIDRSLGLDARHLQVFISRKCYE
ncbi:MAG: class I SAM-dependent methyltransferase [Xenococcaceae cyanobacterium MO_188.B32]|nr:class I SAM-dependent methyltransferase [Xenococcaceae cyanobacterium MO_188.B32]